MSEVGPSHPERECCGNNPWQLPEQEPTNLIAIWPDEHAPLKTEIVSAMSEYFGRKIGILEELEHQDPGIAWCFALKLPTLASPVVFWSEPSQPLEQSELEEFSPRPCKWIVGLETVLSPDDPLTDFGNLMRAVAGALTQVPALLDVNTAIWHGRRELDEVFASDEVEPPADVLWVIQAVRSGEEIPLEDKVVWLHTHGLWRCGAAELEMIGVPLIYTEPAAELMGDIAALLLEQTPPAPGKPFEIGTDLKITLRPANTIAPLLAENIPGGPGDRNDCRENPHSGVRAVICSNESNRETDKPWQWPQEVTEKLMRDQAGVYMTTRATERQGALARATWGHFATAFASIGQMTDAESDDKAVVFGVKAGFAEDDPATSREHLWFEVCCFDADKVHGTLVNQPLAIERLTKGDRVWVEKDRVSDWRVMTDGDCYGPNELSSLWRAIDKYKEE